MSGNMENRAPGTGGGDPHFWRSAANGTRGSAPRSAAAEAAWDARKVGANPHLLDKGLRAARLITEPESLARMLSREQEWRICGVEQRKATQYLEELSTSTPMVLRTVETVPSGGTIVVEFHMPSLPSIPLRRGTTKKRKSC